jgi:hypothetical protein
VSIRVNLWLTCIYLPPAGLCEQANNLYLFVFIGGISAIRGQQQTKKPSDNYSESSLLSSILVMCPISRLVFLNEAGNFLTGDK